MTFTAHFDGNNLVPVGKINLPVNTPLVVTVDENPTTDLPKSDGFPLSRLIEQLKQMPVNEDWPADGSYQHDHYLYGTPKKP